MLITPKEVEFAKVLEKESVEALDKHVRADKETFEDFIKVWDKATDDNKEAILYKLIATNKLVSNKLKSKANRWIKENGLAHTIGRCKE